MHKDKQGGFTLVELLVVISIIGILSTLAVVSLNTARSKSRDARRLSDIRQMQTALEFYYNETGYYPNALGSQIKYGNDIYMEVVPTAPNPPDSPCSSSTNAYAYTPNADFTSYRLNYCLGNITGGIQPGLRTASPGGINVP